MTKSSVDILKRAERRAGFRVTFWILNIPIVLGLYIWAHSTWVEASLLYLAIISIQNNVETSYAGMVGRKAERRTIEETPEDRGD